MANGLTDGALGRLSPNQRQAVNPRRLVSENAHLIGGRWVPATGGETINVINPATQQTIMAVPRGREPDVDAAVRAAAAAFAEWRDISPTTRAAKIHAWGTLCSKHADHISVLESMEVGRPYPGPSDVGARLIYVAGQADKVTGLTLPTSRPDMLAFTLREPFGVCGCIIPWNAPTALMVGNVGPAIAAGNTVVVKPAAEAPLACLLVVKLALEAGIPSGVVNLVTGYGSETGVFLVQHRDIRHMSFTGSPEVGTVVMKACAEHLVPLHLELGGKSPQIVFADANLEHAVPSIVRNVITNAGQICSAGTRLLVAKPLRREVVAAVAAGMKGIRVGAWHEDVDMGPLISAEQEGRVLDYVGAGTEEGAHLIVGGSKLSGARYDQGFFVQPTLFDAVLPTMRIAQEEIFGPVLSVLEFGEPDEAVEIANGTPYGLRATVWTRDLGRAVLLAKTLQAGQVHLNPGSPVGAIGAPFGGYKQSGFGRTMGIDTILEYTQLKSVVLGGPE